MTQEDLFQLIQRFEKEQSTVLDLSDTQLTRLPTEIFKLTNLTELNLSATKLTDLPAEIGKLTNLRRLYLSVTQVTRLPVEIAKLIKLTELNLNATPLTELPAEICKLTNLRKLNLSATQLTELPVEISKLTNLMELNLSDTKLAGLPMEIGKMKNLQRLGLSATQLTRLPAETCNLTNLRGLYLSGTQLTELPAGIGKMKNLAGLNLNNTQLTELPVEIGEMTNLMELNLSGAQLTELPAEIGDLKNLTGLYLSDTHLTELPAEIGKLTNLQGLNISGTPLWKLPEEIGTLTNLKRLYLSDTQLTELPAEIGKMTSLTELYLNDTKLMNLTAEIGKMTNLTALYLSGTQLTELPVEIGKLNKLTVLNLSRTQLMELPAEIDKLTNLWGLYLSGTKLTKLPAGIGKLKNLRGLYLSYTQLTELPEEIGHLTALEELHVINAQLTVLPKSLRQLRTLRKLFLHNNVGLVLPTEVLGPDYKQVMRKDVKPAKPAEIIEYYFRVQAEKQPLNEAKLILLGHGAVGKTSLVNRLVYNTFDKREKKTEGIRITQWLICLNSDEEVRLNIWDFGGQEIMHSTHQFFLTQRSLYLLVLNGRQGHEDSDAEYWLNLIKSFGEDSPIIVVLNKIEEHPFDLNRSGMKQKFSNVRDFIETDCADRLGIDDLHEAIKRETDRLEHLRDAFPASWFTIKERLARMQTNYLTFDRYREVCSENGEADQKAQESLAFYLHSLGIALNYKDDLRLRDTHVLNPHWVTNGIYRIINAANLAKQKGELHVSDLALILDHNDYPPERHSFLLELMCKFELCFSFHEREGNYLIPELLGKQQPAEAKAFELAECLNFQYHYPILPEGLMPRFIVRTHVLSTDQHRWRTGVILEFESNRALVRADIQDKRVIIAIEGPTSGRRRLLAVIRSDFEHIHRNYRFHPEEMIPLPGNPNALVPYNKLLVLEQNGLNKFPEVFGGHVRELDVRELLNGVDLEGTRADPKDADSVNQSLRLFYSYSHKDEGLRDELETHLKLIHRLGMIKPWHDRCIAEGDEWKGKIDDNMEEANIILLLVSADFIASDYCYDIEMKRALERHGNGETLVIPIIVRDVSWHSAPFAKLQALPKNGEAVKTWPDRDTAWRHVAEGIEKVVKELRAKIRRQTE